MNNSLFSLSLTYLLFSAYNKNSFKFIIPPSYNNCRCVYIYMFIYILIKVWSSCLLDCLRPCVDSIIPGFSRSVMKVSNLDTIDLSLILFNFNFIDSIFIYFIYSVAWLFLGYGIIQVVQKMLLLKRR